MIVMETVQRTGAATRSNGMLYRIHSKEGYLVPAPTQSLGEPECGTRSSSVRVERMVDRQQAPHLDLLVLTAHALKVPLETSRHDRRR